MALTDNNYNVVSLSGTGPTQVVANYPIAASTKIWRGQFVNTNTSGYLIPATNSASEQAIGVVVGTRQDNSGGSNGDLSIDVLIQGVIEVTTDVLNVTQSSVGKLVYFTNDETMTTTANNLRAIGRIISIKENGNVVIGIDY